MITAYVEGWEIWGHDPKYRLMKTWKEVFLFLDCWLYSDTL